MQQDAGLRLKCLGGSLACGRWPISLIYRATEWSYYGAACATSSCFPPLAKNPPPPTPPPPPTHTPPPHPPPGAATPPPGGRRPHPRVGSRTSPSGPKEQPQPRRQPHTPTLTIYTHPIVFNNNASPCKTIDFTRYYRHLDNLVTCKF